MACGSWDNVVILWSVETQKEIAELKGHNESVNCVTFSHDGKYIISGSSDDTIIIWSFES